MEKRINQKARTYLQQFKNDIQGFIKSNNMKVITLNDTGSHKDDANTLLQFIYDYQPLEFQKTDFQKKKKSKKMLFLFSKGVVLLEQMENNALDDEKITKNFVAHI